MMLLQWDDEHNDRQMALDGHLPVGLDGSGRVLVY